MSFEPHLPNDIAIAVSNLTKTFRLFDHPGDRIKQFLSIGLKTYHREFTALREVSFDIHKGETVGIIGRNGAGKSTLLQLICGVLKPTSGSVRSNGRIAALLELGAGFNPEFTGRENAYFVGAIYGIPHRTLDAVIDDIAAFADIGAFFDHPVRTYSSGMFVRLAYAVAIQISPDILVVDEALAVGDVKFQAKCFRQMTRFRNNGGTILLVTHALEHVGHHCNRAILLDSGIIKEIGPAGEILTRYVGGRAIEPNGPFISHPPFKNPARCLTPDVHSRETRWGDGKASITVTSVIQEGNDSLLFFRTETPIKITACVEFYDNVTNPIYGLTVKSVQGDFVLNTNSRDLCTMEPKQKFEAGDLITVEFSFEPRFDPGSYQVSLGIVSDYLGEVIPHDRRYNVVDFVLDNPEESDGQPWLNPKCRIYTAS